MRRMGLRWGGVGCGGCKLEGCVVQWKGGRARLQGFTGIAWLEEV